VTSTIVVKIGGEVVGSGEAKVLAHDIRAIVANERVAIVHGGGPQATALSKQLGIATVQVAGRRVTDAATLDVMKMIVAGKLNVDLCAILAAAGVSAVGLHGASGLVVRAEKRAPKVYPSAGPEPVDLGLVGDVVEVDPGAVLDLVRAGRIPVVSSIAPEATGQVLNVNADTAAAALAVALGAVKLVVLTDVEGLYSDWPDRSSLVQQIGADELETVLPQIDSGMAPKMAACLRAVRGGVARATGVDGRLPHALLLEMVTSEGTGTMVTP
jgi:acetylglutamate kinase